MRTFLVAALLAILPAVLAADEQPWSSDYTASYRRAREEGKYLLLWFIRETPTSDQRRFGELLASEEFRETLDSYVVVQLTTQSRLLSHASFSEMLKSPGLAIIDLRDANSPHFGDLVSVHPSRSGKPLESQQLHVALKLPSGSLTQRTLIYAVRTHRERPRSTYGVADGMLIGEATKHASHQASIRLQGHHNWDRRFRSISAKLPRGLHAQEVCAESWPGQGLVAAAEECVDSWRQSPGHWSAVSSLHPRYGYDMKRGSNGVWYAAGLFGRK